MNEHKIFSRFSRRLVIIIILAVCVCAGVISGSVVLASSGGGAKFRLSMPSRNLTFFTLDTQYDLPAVESKNSSFTVEWKYVSSDFFTDTGLYVASSEIAGHDYPLASLTDDDNNKFTLNMIDESLNAEQGRANFVAVINGSVELPFTVNVTDRGEDYFETLSSNQHGSYNYMTQGIGKSRVFGLYDYSNPASEITPENFMQTDYVKSGDVFNLQWSYKKPVKLDVYAVDSRGNPSDVVDVIYDSETDAKKVTVNFLKTGTAKVIAKSDSEYAPGRSATYEYVYNIVDGVNTYDFSDIKLMERLARYDYIVNGVRQQQGGAYVERSDGTELSGVGESGLENYIVPNSDPNGLLSAHFKETATTYSSAGLAYVPGVEDYTGDTTGSYYNEFELWAPAYRYKDIVIRSTDKDPNVAQREQGLMYTWAESTWFFGSVYGNGYRLDATTYTRGVEGYDDPIYQNPSDIYRNTHSMRGDNITEADKNIDNALAKPKKPGLEPYALGFDGKKFFQGYGWGEVFAFYALANNSFIDNLTMTGENIPSGTESIRLNQYRKIGVLGVSTLSGGKYKVNGEIVDMPFGQANAHDAGVPIKGLYNENIVVQNSILEKGLTLFGANYAPDADNPLVADNCVFRYAGFAAIVGNSYGGGVGGVDFEGGRDIAANNPLSGGLKGYVDNYFGNFIVARNNIYHDISVTPLLTMPSLSGTHIEVQGANNGFFTWLQSNDIQFPTMKNEVNEGEYVILGKTINDAVIPLMNKLFGTKWVNKISGGDNLDAKNILPNGTYVINIPYISVMDSGAATPTNPVFNKNNRNFLNFAGSSIDGAALEDYGFVSDAMAYAGQQNQGFFFTMLLKPDPNNPATANLTRYEDQTLAGIDAKIAAMIPVQIPVF